MRCPYCGTLDNKVIDSRLSQGGEVTRRRRECDSCGRRYTTYERVEQALPYVVKKDGSKQLFDGTKLLAGLRRSCAKRDVPVDLLERIVEQVQRAVIASGEQEVPSTLIGNETLRQLRPIDPVAYVRFASVYQEFSDVGEFMAVLESFLEDEEPPRDPVSEGPKSERPSARASEAPLEQSGS